MVDPGEKDTITVNGINAARVSVMVTTIAREDACTPPHAVVETVAMAAAKNASTAGPLIFIVFADRDVPWQLADDDLKKVIGSIRPYKCPPGTTTRGDNKCSSGSSARAAPAG